MCSKDSKVLSLENPTAKWGLVTIASQRQAGGEHLQDWAPKQNSNRCLSTSGLYVLGWADCCGGGWVWALLFIVFAGCSSPVIFLIVALKILLSI